MTNSQNSTNDFNDPTAKATGESTLNSAPASKTQESATQTTSPQPKKNKAQKNKSKQPATKVEGSLAGGTWTALIVGAILLILLLVFIVQNSDKATLQLFAWQWNFPIGVGMLIAAIAGALIMALVGGVRMAQLRKQVKNGRR